MKRIAIISECEPDLQTQRCIETLRAGLGADYAFALQSVNAKSLVGTLGRVLGVRKACQDAEVVHAFGYRALKVASFAAGKRLLYTPLPGDGLAAVKWVLAAMARRTLQVVCMGGGAHRFLLTQGVPAERCTVVYPGIRMPRTGGKDAQLRAKLGLREGDIGVLAVGQSEPWADHALAVHAVTVLHNMNPRFRCILWGRGSAVPAIERLHATWKADSLIHAERVLGGATEFEPLIAAADLGLITAPERLSAVPVLACMAGGLPLVGPATAQASELLENGSTALFYAPQKMRPVAHRLLALSEDVALQAKLADQARAQAYELFSVSRFLDQMRQVYSSSL